jgi:hypothetical protein
LNKPETEVIVRNKRGSKTNRKGKVDDYYLRRALARLPSASSVARRLLLLLAMILGFALIGKRKPVLFIGLVKQIVASDSGLGSWRVSQKTWKVERCP